MTRLDARAISALLAERIDQLVRELLPDGRARGDSWRIGGLAGEKGRSLSIALSGAHQGWWRDFATEQRGDSLDLVKSVLGHNTSEALAWSRQWLDRRSGEAHAPAAEAGYGDDQTRRVERALAIWDESIDPRSTLADSYLSHRGLRLTDSLALDPIRYHRACPWSEAGRAIRVPAMIVAMRSIETDEITAIQRTRLSPRAVKIERRMLGAASAAAIKLDADERVIHTLHVGEGVETAMTARQIGLKPAWALGSAGAIAAFPVLRRVEVLTILVERDDASESAAEACGTRWHDAGCEVLINRPTKGKDLNDALQAMLRSRRSMSGRRRNS